MKRSRHQQKHHWFGDRQRQEIIPHLISFVPVHTLCWCIASYLYPRYCLISPSQTGDLKKKRHDDVHGEVDVDSDEEIDEELGERLGYWFKCPIGQKEEFVFEVEHPDDGEGWSGQFVSFQIKVPLFQTVTRFVVTNHGGATRSSTEWNGIAWSKEEEEGKVENHHVVFDEGMSGRCETNTYIRCCIVSLPNPRLASSDGARVIGVTTNNEFVCAYTEIRTEENPEQEENDILTTTLENDGVLDDLVCENRYCLNDTPLLVLDLS